MKISKTQVFISGSVIALSLIVSTPVLRAEAHAKRGASFINVMRNGGVDRGFQGSIGSKTANSFTLEKYNRTGTTTVTILTTATTTFTKDAESATFADIASGEHVVVKGSKDVGTGIITASSVHIYTQVPAKHPSFRRMHDHKKMF